MIIPIYILHLLLIHLSIISAGVFLDIPLNLIRKKINKYNKGKRLFSATTMCLWYIYIYEICKHISFYEIFKRA